MQLRRTGVSGRNAARSTPCGTCSSSTMMVMMMASTPSLNASSRPVLISGVAVDDAPVDDGQHRTDLLDLFVRDREVVAIEDHGVRQPARFEAADPILHPQEPAVLTGEQAQGLLPGELLVA